LKVLQKVYFLILHVTTSETEILKVLAAKKFYNLAKHF